MKNNSVVITIIVAVVVGALAFFGGMQYQQMQNKNRFGQFANAQGARGQNAGFRRFGAGAGANGRGNVAMGSVVSVDANSITLKLQDGSSKIINLSGSTTYSKTASGAKTDVKTGSQIAVFGTPNSDGSISADTVQLNPMMRPFRNGPTGTPAQ